MLGLWAYKDIFKKIGWTIFILMIYKLMMLFVLPGVDPKQIKELFSTGIFKTINFFAGGSMDRASIFANGIGPYLTATTILNFLSSKSGISFFRQLKQESEIGTSKLNEYVQYLTILLSFIQAVYYCSVLWTKQGPDGLFAVYIPKWLFFLTNVPILVVGSMINVWIASQLSRYGLGKGQGISLILFTNIINNLQINIYSLYNCKLLNIINNSQLFLAISFLLAILLLVLIVEGAKRLIPIRYAGLSGKYLANYMPLKINNSGLSVPVLTSSLLLIPQILIGICDWLGITTLKILFLPFVQKGIFHFIFHSILIFFISMLQTELSFDPEEVAYDLQKNGIIVIGFAPRESTANYLRKIFDCLNFLNSIYLIIICVGTDLFCLLFNKMIFYDCLNFNGSTILSIVTISQSIFSSIKYYNYNQEVENLMIKKN